MGDRLRISLLGPVSVHIDAGAAPVRSRPQRVVLSCLALQADRVVSTGTLIDALWPDDPPPGAAGNLHSYVSKLRRVVGPDRILHEHGGYRLRVDADAVDAIRVERLADAAEQLDDRPKAAALAEALSLWEGQPMSDLDDVAALWPERARLAGLQRQLDLRRMTALVDAGDHTLALPDLHQAAARDPHDESIVVLLARALHGAGRTTEALRIISDHRRTRAESTGLEVSAALARLEQRILLDDPTLHHAHHGADRAPDAGPAPATAEWQRFTTPLHGRREELAWLDGELRSRQIVTVAGPGGVGKTRLACALADRRSSGGQDVHFLPLAALRPDDDLAARLAAALGLRVHAGQDLVQAVHERIGSGGQLLVLDNCEHVLDPVRRLVDHLLVKRTDLTVVTTSRTPLGLTAERVLRIAPLHAAGRAASDLFVDRARRVRPGFAPSADELDALRTVVRGTGGLPLAIELAAGRMASMSLADLAARIDDLGLLTGGATERHRTLRGAIDWSHRLLPEPARRLLRTLSAFPGGVDLAIVEDLAADLQLTGGGAAEAVALADASLVDVDLGRTVRYTMLEPVRNYARERLEDAGEQAFAYGLRSRWARRTAAWIESTCRSDEEAAADARLRSQLVNLRAAHRWSLQEGDLDTAIAISTALIRPATARDLPEIWSWALDLAEHPGLVEHPCGADALGAAANAAWLNGDLTGAERMATDGLGRDPHSVPCLQALGSVRLLLGEPDAAHQLWMAASEPHGAYLPQAALAAVYTGDGELAGRSLDAADAWAAGVGSPSEAALCRYARGELLAPAPAALRAYEDAISLAVDVGATFVAAISRVGLASTLAANGRHRRAIAEFDAVIRYWRTTGNWTQQWTTLRNVADLLDALDRGAAARRIRAAAAAAPAAPPTPTSARELPVRGRAAPEHDDAGGPAPGPAEALIAAVIAELAELRLEAETVAEIEIELGSTR